MILAQAGNVLPNADSAQSEIINSQEKWTRKKKNIKKKKCGLCHVTGPHNQKASLSHVYLANKYEIFDLHGI